MKVKEMKGSRDMAKVGLCCQMEIHTRGCMRMAKEMEQAPIGMIYAVLVMNLKEYGITNSVVSWVEINTDFFNRLHFSTIRKNT